jgi:hypothetical protein
MQGGNETPSVLGRPKNYGSSYLRRPRFFLHFLLLKIPYKKQGERNIMCSKSLIEYEPNKKIKKLKICFKNIIER